MDRSNSKSERAPNASALADCDWKVGTAREASHESPRLRQTAAEAIRTTRQIH